MRPALLTSAAILLVASLSGCGGDNRSILWTNLTPELQGLHERPEDVTRNLAVVNNANMRMLSDDLGRTFYTHAPSRLNPFPSIGLSGNPY